MHSILLKGFDFSWLHLFNSLQWKRHAGRVQARCHATKDPSCNPTGIVALKPLASGTSLKKHSILLTVGGHVHLTWLFDLWFEKASTTSPPGTPIMCSLAGGRESHVLIYNWTQPIDPEVHVINMSVSAVKSYTRFFFQEHQQHLVSFLFTYCPPTLTGVTYRPAGGAGTVSSDVVAHSSVLTGAALLTLRPVTTGGAALSTAVTTCQKSNNSDTKLGFCLQFFVSTKHALTNNKRSINIYFVDTKERVAKE